uniref:Coiled-coil domain-containing protein 58 n=1 Tax=Panagrolaimus sp. PS1159 TaxID=55785 RepID=A0AC35FXG7_9BILA
MATDASIDCTNLADFQRLLNKYRGVEDRIMFQLNASFSTRSFKDAKATVQICHGIEEKLESVRKLRSDLFNRCINENYEIVQKFKDDDSKFQLVRNANSTLRQIRNEQAVDEIIHSQAERVVNDRCKKEAIL